MSGKNLALASAKDFQQLFDSVPEPHHALASSAKYILRPCPLHGTGNVCATKNVNSYYFGEIGVPAEDGPDIAACRKEGFSSPGKSPSENLFCKGSFGEEWSYARYAAGLSGMTVFMPEPCTEELTKFFGKERLLNPFLF